MGRSLYMAAARGTLLGAGHITRQRNNTHNRVAPRTAAASKRGGGSAGGDGATTTTYGSDATRRRATLKP